MVKGGIGMNKEVLRDFGLKRYKESCFVKDKTKLEIEKSLQLLELLNQDVDCLYVNDEDYELHGINPVYCDGIFIYELKELLVWDIEKFKTAFISIKNIVHEAYKNGNYMRYSMYVSRKYSMMLYYNIFNSGNMNNKQLFEGFIEALQKSNYKIEDVHEGIISEITAKIPSKLLKLRKESKEKKITIYKAIPNNRILDSMLSWSKDIDVAKMLGKKEYGSNYSIIRGQVDIKNIVIDFDKEVGILFGVDDYTDHLKEVFVKEKSVVIA